MKLILISLLLTQFILPVKAKITFLDDDDSIHIDQVFDYIGSDNKYIFIRSIQGFLKKSKSLNIPCDNVFSVNVGVLGNRIRTKCENNCIQGNCYSGYGEYEFGVKGVYKGFFLNGKPIDSGSFIPRYGWIYKNGTFLKAPKSRLIEIIDIISTISLFALLLAVMIIFYTKTKKMDI